MSLTLQLILAFGQFRAIIINNIYSYNLSVIKEKVMKLEKTNCNKQKKDR